MKTRVTLGERLEALRLEGGQTLTGLSRESGIPLTTVHRLFRDRVAKPNPAHLVTLARAFRVHPDVLLAAARYPTCDLDAALRAAYCVPNEAIAQMRTAVEAVAARYAGAAGTGAAQ